MLIVSEYLKHENEAFTRTLSIETFANDAEKIGLSSDVFRFYMMFISPESYDSSFNWINLIIANNDELLINLGTFCDR